jgi:hypothetical protein
MTASSLVSETRMLKIEWAKAGVWVMHYMNNENCGIGNEQSFGWVQDMKWFTIDYQLWYSLIIKKWIIVVKPFKHIMIRLAHSVLFISIILNVFGWKLSKKCVTKWTSKAGKCCIGELVHRKIYIIFYECLGRTLKTKLLIWGKLNIQETLYQLLGQWEIFGNWWNSNGASYNVENIVHKCGPKLKFFSLIEI